MTVDKTVCNTCLTVATLCGTHSCVGLQTQGLHITMHSHHNAAYIQLGMGRRQSCHELAGLVRWTRLPVAGSAMTLRLLHCPRRCHHH